MLNNATCLCLVIGLLLRIASSLSVPQASVLSQSQNQLQPLSQISNLTGSYTCIPSSKFSPYTRRPSLRDCGGTIVRLPSSADIETFKTRAVFPFQLPVNREIGSCKITVGFASHATSCRSSWTEIGLAATAMSLACIKGSNTGGVAYTGDQTKIVISLDYIKNPDPDFEAGDTEVS